MSAQFSSFEQLIALPDRDLALLVSRLDEDTIRKALWPASEELYTRMRPHLSETLRQACDDERVFQGDLPARYFPEMPPDLPPLRSFDELHQLTAREIQTALRSVDQDSVVLALVGSGEPTRRKFLDNMSHRVGDWIEAEMNRRKNTSADEVRRAQEEVLAVFLQVVPGAVEEARRLVGHAIEAQGRVVAAWETPASMREEICTAQCQPIPRIGENTLTRRLSMGVVLGYLVVVCSVAIGYLVLGGEFTVLCQPAMLIIIVGSAAGALLTAGGFKGVKDLFGSIVVAMRSQSYDKQRYKETLKLMHDIIAFTNKEGVLGLEEHVKAPQTSFLFTSAPSVSRDPQVLAFIVDCLRWTVCG